MLTKISPEYLHLYIQKREQTESKFTISIETTFEKSSFVFNFYKNKNAIEFLHKSASNPLVCGCLSMPIVNCTYSRTQTGIVIDITKSTAGIWPMLIYQPFKSKIDPQSYFENAQVLAQSQQDAQKFKAEAIFHELFEINYSPMVLVFAQSQLYQKIVDDKVILKLKELIFDYQRVDAADMYSIFCTVNLIPVQNAFPVIQKGKEIGSLSCGLLLAMWLSSLNEPHGDFENDVEAVSLLREIGLNNHHTKYFLGIHLINGIGCDKDVEEGMRLVNEARKDDPSLPPLPSPSPPPLSSPPSINGKSLLQTLVVGGTVTALLVGVGYCLVRLWKRKH